MTGQVYAVAGGKGGVGKTTTVVNVATVLQEAGCDVVVVDADLGMANLGAMFGVDNEPTLHRVLAGEAAISDALTEGPGGITVLPGRRDLQAFADADPANLRKVIESLSAAYDVVLVDTGAGLSHEVIVPLGLADSVVLVTTTEDVAVGDAAKTVELTERIDGDVIGAVLTRADDDTDVSAVADELDLEVLAVVPETGAVAGPDPLVLSEADGRAAEAYRRLAATLEGIDTAPASAVEDGPADGNPESGEPVEATEEGADASGGDENGDKAREGNGDEDEDDGSGGVLGLFG